MMSYIWMSFVDPDTGKNLGCAIIKADTLDEAITRAWDLKLNPGGEVMSSKLNEEEFELQGLEVERLYSREELKKLEFKTINE